MDRPSALSTFTKLCVAAALLLLLCNLGVAILRGLGL